jgi:hypothetical protein
MAKSHQKDQNLDPFADGDEVFDPFNLGFSPVSADDVSTGTPIQAPPQVERLTRAMDKRRVAAKKTPSNKQTQRVAASSDLALSPRALSPVLPPKLIIKFTTHEEVSSIAKKGAEHEGSSEIFVEGKLSVSSLGASSVLECCSFCDLTCYCRIMARLKYNAPMP